MAVNYIKGQILSGVLERDGLDISIANANVGINTLLPAERLDVNGNILADNLFANVTVSATGNVIGGNILTTGLVNATGNVTGGNLLTGGLALVTGNISSGSNITADGNITATNNVTGNNINGNTVSATGNSYADIFVGNTVSATGNSYANIFVGNTAYLVTVSVAGNVLIGNKRIPATGNINAGNVNINNVVDPVQNQDAATKFYVDNGISNIGNIGNLTFSNTTISTNLANGNITLQPTGNGLVIINTTTGLVLPTGTTAERPTPPVTGTVRFNTTTSRVEVYDGTIWDQVTSGVTNQVLNGDGTTTTFTLDRSTTTAAVLVMLNGLTQVPGTAYNMSPSPSTNLVFNEAPANGDVIDVRFL